jgi:hypothetical protein
MLLDIWMDIPCDLMPLMHHIVGAPRLLAARRAPDDRHKSSSNVTHLSSTPLIDECVHDHSFPHPPHSPSPHPDNEEAKHITHPPLSPYLYQHSIPIPHPPLSRYLDDHATCITHPPLLTHLDDHDKHNSHPPLSPNLDEQA